MGIIQDIKRAIVPDGDYVIEMPGSAVRVSTAPAKA